MIEVKQDPSMKCLENVDSWLQYVGMPEPWMLLKRDEDRVFLKRTKSLEDGIKRLAIENKIEEADASLHGADVEIGYRECVGRCAAQIVIHKDSIEIDFDYWHPWDLVGLIGHGWEVFSNKIKKKKTDPFKVAKMLEKRGVVNG